MKRVLLAVLLLSCLAVAQEKTYSVPESQLTEEQKSKFTKPNALTVQNVHDWAGLGKEIGEAVNGSLSAVTTQANNFAQTPVGKLTAAVVIFKVIGDPAIHIAVGMVEAIVLLPLWIWSYRRFLPRKVLVSEKRNDAGKIIERNYDLKLLLKSEAEVQGFIVGHYFMLIALAVVILTTIFSY